jgi:hypothetical protein
VAILRKRGHRYTRRLSSTNIELTLGGHTALIRALLETTRAMFFLAR